MKRLLTALAVICCFLACEKVPEEILVTSVSLNQATAEMVVGETISLSATVLPSNATEKTVTWASSNQSVATVAGGKVTAVSEGQSTITASAGGKSATCIVTVGKKTIDVASVELNKTELSLTEGESETLIATVKPDDATDKTVTWSTSNNTIATVENGKVTAVKEGEASITARAGEEEATCKVVVKKTIPSGAVDLGLSVYWGTTNLGAGKPEEYGDYYAWGETEPYYSSQSPLTWKNGKSAGYNWASYKWYNGSSSTLTKYNTKSSYGTVDNKTVLDQEDDVASVKLGGKWRMPTDAEWTELSTKCTWTWTTNYNGTGVEGQIFTATNGNSIFLPATGRRDNSILYDAGSGGYYWSSSLSTDRPSFAWFFGINSNDASRYDDYRCSGFSVRPVSE